MSTIKYVLDRMLDQRHWHFVIGKGEVTCSIVVWVVIDFMDAQHSYVRNLSARKCWAILLLLAAVSLGTVISLLTSVWIDKFADNLILIWSLLQLPFHLLVSEFIPGEVAIDTKYLHMAFGVVLNASFGAWIVALGLGRVPKWWLDLTSKLTISHSIIIN